MEKTSSSHISLTIFSGMLRSVSRNLREVQDRNRALRAVKQEYTVTRGPISHSIEIEGFYFRPEREMRFRFCGDLEAPSWLLHEMSTLSEISSVRLKLLVKQVMNQILKGSLDYEKVTKFLTLPQMSDHQKPPPPPDASMTKGALSAVRFILASAAKYDIDEETLAKEIEQLGLPRENARAILRPYRESKSALRAKFAADTFSVQRTNSIRCVKTNDNYLLKIQLEDEDPNGTNFDVSVPARQLPILIHEMEQVLALMESSSSS